MIFFLSNFFILSAINICLLCYCFRLAVQDVMLHSGLFEGTSRKYFSSDIDMMSSDKYRLAGQLVALSLKYDGPGPQCMHPAEYRSIVSDIIEPGNLVVDDLPDCALRVVICTVRFV